MYSLERFIIEYSEIPIVLCHCGFTEGKEDEIFKRIIHLYKYDNFYIDITFNVMHYFINNLDKLNIISTKAINGSDLNPRLFEKYKDNWQTADTIIRKQSSFNNYINSNNILHKIFNL